MDLHINPHQRIEIELLFDHARTHSTLASILRSMSMVQHTEAGNGSTDAVRFGSGTST